MRVARMGDSSKKLLGPWRGFTKIEGLPPMLKGPPVVSGRWNPWPLRSTQPKLLIRGPPRLS